jgi:hypothetical protein
VPGHGNQRTRWDEGERFGWESPEYFS